jgi:glucokinase
MIEGFVAGIDLGGTKILSVCLDANHNVVGRDYRETGAEDGPDVIIERMAASARAAAADRPLRGVGISSPGPADLTRGLVTDAPNLPGWHNIPLADLVSQKLGVATWLENDANAAALAEHRLGAGRGSQHLILVTIGTGIGGGLILDGRLYHGASGGAGEIGHMLVEPQGRVCGCGRRGCLEAMASGSALNAAAREIATAEPNGLVAQTASREGVEPDARILDEAAEAGDPSALAAMERAGRYLGVGLTNLVNIFNPQVIVVGGSVRKSALYLNTAIAVMQRDAFAQHRADVRVVEAALDGDEAAIGVALLALDNLTAHPPAT